jgi:ferredoxin-NADP reductase
MTRARTPLRLLEALATPHHIDRYLELVNPMLTVRELRARIAAVSYPTADTVRLVLRPTRQWRGFRAGQFVQVSIDIGGVRRTRCYSPINSQYRGDGSIELTVKVHPDGVVSPWLRAHARPGLVVGLAPAEGTFCLPDERPERLLLISGGSGITPVLAMLRTLCDEGHRGEVAFVHYAPTPDAVPYRAELTELAARHDNVHVLFGHPDTDAGELRGLFGPDHLASAAPWHADAVTYLCGPPGLMRAVREHYKSAGRLDQLHVEEFAPVAAPAGRDEASGTVRFTASGTSTDNSGASLLDQAEAAGLAPEYGCRMGICFTCTQVKTAGCTRNIRTGETDDDPDTEIQLCINVPVGDVAIAI